jgi:WD40 repeat protein
MLASGSRDCTLRLWDVATGKEIAVLGDNPGMVYSMAFTSDGKSLVTSGEHLDSEKWAGSIKVWDLRTRQVRRTIPFRDCPEMALAPDGKTVATNVHRLAETDVTLWDLTTGKELGKLKGLDELLEVLIFSPDGKRLAAGNRNGGIQVWDVRTRKSMREFKPFDHDVRALAFSPDGKTLASVGRPTWIKLHDVETGDQRSLFETRGCQANCMTYSPDGKTLATAFFGLVYLYDPVTGKVKRTLTKHEETIQSLAFSPDGKLIATAGGSDKTIILAPVPADD